MYETMKKKNAGIDEKHNGVVFFFHKHQIGVFKLRGQLTR